MQDLAAYKATSSYLSQTPVKVYDVFFYSFGGGWIKRKLNEFLAAFPQYTADTVITYGDDVWYDLYWFHDRTRATLVKMLEDGYISTEAENLSETAAQETLQASVQVTDIEDHTFTFRQRAYYLQNGSTPALLNY